MRAALLLALALLAGCRTTTPQLPVAAQCNPLCLAPCAATVEWNADPDDAAAWDVLAGEVVPALVAAHQTCEAHRRACEQCLRRIERAGIITINGLP